MGLGLSEWVVTRLFAGKIIGPRPHVADDILDQKFWAGAGGYSVKWRVFLALNGFSGAINVFSPLAEKACSSNGEAPRTL